MNALAKRALAAGVSLSLLVSAGLPAGRLTGVASAAEPDGLLFSSSFEREDGLELLENVGEGTAENVIQQYRSGVRGYVGELVDLTSVAGSGTLTGGENMQMLFDGNVDTKFLQVADPTESEPVWVSFKLKEEKVITTYSICAGNDSQPRDPADWTLYGSADGKAWTALDSREGETFYSRKQENIYAVENDKAYAHYKLSITKKRAADNCVQLSELRLGTGVGDMYVPAAASSGTVGNTGKYVLPKTVAGTPDNGNENKNNLFDGDTGSKCFMPQRPSSGNPNWVSFALSEPKVITTYAIGTADDTEKFPERNPVDWTLYGSADGESWNKLDQQSGQSINKNQTIYSYEIENTVSYAYYKLEITKNNGGDSVQISELQLATGVEEYPVTLDHPNEGPMYTARTDGPDESWVNYSNVGWTGFNSLMVAGSHVGTGHAAASNVLYKDLDIPVTATTRLSYMIFPAMAIPNTYDFDYTSQYMSVDLLFDDGSYLSDLSCADIYGNAVNPVAQGDSKTLTYMQWNQVAANIGKAAAGKTIKKILVAYEKNASSYEATAPFLSYFDDIVIENKAEVVGEHLSEYTNIFRGSNSTSGFTRGLTSPVVLLPHGFNMMTPVTQNRDSKHYRYQLGGNRNTICHFNLTHIATAWGSSYGDWEFMPNTTLAAGEVTSADPIGAESRRAEFSHDNEVGNAHYYGVTFDEGSNASKVKVEYTPTDHAMLVRFTFPEGAENRNLILDDVYTSGKLTFDADKKTFQTYTDHRNSGGNRMYVYGQFDTAYDTAKTFDNKTGFVCFPENEKGDTVITMKVSTSFISADQAKHNMALEVPGDATFESVYKQAQKIWDDQLGIIELEGADPYELETFYSSMYRLFAYPNSYHENTGTNENPVWKHANPASSDVAKPEVMDGTLYVNNGFWDTYRTTWPAYAFFTPEKAGDMLDGLLGFYKDTGWVPRWTNPAGNDGMNGSHSEVIFGDAAMRGVDFDKELAFEASIKSANAQLENANLGGRKENNTYPFKHYISNQVDNSVSWTMENYVNDFGTSQLAAALHKTDEAAYLRSRSLNYIQLYNEEIGGFFSGRGPDGSWAANPESFDPTNWWGDYTETNAWTFLFNVPQDAGGLGNLFGGKAAMAGRLDEFFNADPEMNQDGGIHEMREVREVRMGMYGHSNQPAHAIAYLYDYAGQPYKTQEKIREVMSRMYVGNGIGQGYIGDEDNGEQSAWYIFSALGFYPTSVGNPEFAIGSPLFTKATVHLENGKDLVIKAPDNTDENIYVQGVKWNGKAYDKTYFMHEDLAAGGTIEFEMGDKPSAWGTDDNVAPTSITTGSRLPAPMDDFTQPGMKTGTKLDTASESMLAGNVIGLQSLVDNTSDTQVTLTGSDKSVVYYSETPKRVSIYTLASGQDASKAPSAFTLYGSADGENWTELDSRTEQSFQWKQYVRPFCIANDKQAAYSYYKLTFTGSGEVQVSEWELLGNEGVNRAGLDAALQKAAGLHEADYTADTWADLQKAVEAAGKLADDASQDDVDAAAKAVEDAIDALKPSKVIVKGDLTGDGKIDVSDVMAACRVLARKSLQENPTDDEMARGDVNEDGFFTITDVMAICKILAARV